MALSQEQLKVLSSHLGDGRITAQVPEYLIDFNNEHASEEELQAQTAQLIKDGLLAWKVANSAPGRPKVIYTETPLNPATKREVVAYLWMTPLAVDIAGDDLYSAYCQANVFTKKKDTPLAREEWELHLRHDCVPAAPQFAHLTTPPPKLPKKTTPKPDLSLDANGFTKRLGVRAADKFMTGRYRDEKTFMDELDRLHIGPSTDMGEGILSDPLWFERALIQHGGKAGIERLAQLNKLTVDSYALVAWSLGDHRIDQVLERWNAIKAAGISPKGLLQDGGTLWHTLKNNAWSSKLVDWIANEGVDWSVANHEGQVPLSSLFSAISRSIVDAVRSDLFGGVSLFDQMKKMAGMMGHGSEIAQMDQEMKDDEKNLSRSKKLALTMIRSGVDVFKEDNEGMRPINQLFPEQMHMERALHRVAPAGVEPHTFAMQVMFTADRNQLVGYRPGYSKAMVEFIEKIEAITGQSILHDNVPQIGSSPRLRRGP